MRIRIGNSFEHAWVLENSEDLGLIDLNTAIGMTVTARVHRVRVNVPYEIVGNDTLLFKFDRSICGIIGDYNLELNYFSPDTSLAPKDREKTIDIDAFTIVSRTAQADDVKFITSTSDIAMAFKGDKGDPFTYDDFTQQQLDAIQQPITDFVAVAEVAENQREENEDVRIDNESGRVQADLSREQRTNTAIQAVTDAQIESEEVTSEAINDFNTRVEVVEDAEVIREQQEEARQTNTATAITNAENAITDVNAAKDDYYDVVKPAIQTQGEYATAQGDYAKQQGEAVDGRISEVEGKIGYSLGWYGIEFDETIANSACTRIGEMDLHRRLPIQNQMRRCLLLDNGKVNYYLHKDDSTKKENGSNAILDGTDGQVMVEIPAHWRKFEKDGTVHRVKISDFKLEGFHFVPKAYRSAYEATVHRPTDKLSSVVNMSADYRGGNNSSNNDGTSASLLGKPASNISATNFAAYAKNRGDRWCMDVYHIKKTMDWLYYIEFANFNSQLPFNPTLTAEGFKQGGLSGGVSDLNSSKWSGFNGSYPFIPMGYTNSLGNKTGVKPFDMPVEYDENIFTTNVPSYRGVENPFGHIWKWADGLKINIQADDAGGESQMFVCEDPLFFQHSNYDGYEKRGLLPRTNGYISKMIMGEFGELMPKEAVAGSTTYFADYWYTALPASGESQRGVRFGGTAEHGATAGLACSHSPAAFSRTYWYVGSRLCFLP